MLLGSVVLSLIPALSSVRRLREGRVALAEARSSLLDADAGAASDAFARARLAFTDASGNANNVLTDLPSMLPLLGRTYEALRTLAGSGRQIAVAGEQVAGAVGSLPGGPAALGPHHGRLPLGRYE
ncbi:MAG TPA: hypothetical protein VE646_02155, partial [Actinomycetota bacterium]|nr:hypothetical protein [Actinomycetota bacterium]